MNDNTRELFKKLRKQSSLSQDNLAQILGYNCGQMVSNFERGVSAFPYKKIHEAINLLIKDDFQKFVVTNQFQEAIAQDEIKKFRDAKN